MKKFVFKLLTVIMTLGFAISPVNVFAEGDEDLTEAITKAATSISISPVSKIIQLQPNKVYEDTLNVTNNSESAMNFETYASPYSYTRENEESDYQLGFNQETAYTQITRWITFVDPYGNYTNKARYTADPGQTVHVRYRISTPASIPAGGQYAVIFAHTLSSTSNSGIRTEASPGMIIYGHADGETIFEPEFNDLRIGQTVVIEDANNNQTTENKINASAKVKNSGNTDFMANGVLIIDDLFGNNCYLTPANKAHISVIPETELSVSDSWDETPFFGIFNVSWTVTAGEKSETINSIIFILPPIVIIGILLVLTFISIWIIMIVRKRKERRARLSV